RDIPDNNRRRRAGDANHVVMFRQPEAPVTPPLRMLRAVQCIAQSIRWRSAFRNKCEIKNRERRHTATLIPYLMKTTKPQPWRRWKPRANAGSLNRLRARA